MKKVYPEAKIVWIDAHIDANTPESSPSGNAHGMPLTYLAGLVPGQEQWKCVDIASELCYFGIRSYEDDELALIKDQQVLVFEAPFCHPEKLDDIEIIMKQYFKNAEKSQKEKKLNQTSCPTHQKYWLSFDIDSVDASEFRSTGTAEDKGITRDFVKSFFDRMVSHSIGLDFSEVNFDLCEGEILAADEEAFREIFEVIVTSVNKTVRNQIYDDW
jgi:arginase